MKDIAIIDNYADLAIGTYLRIVALRRDASLTIYDRQPKEIALLTGLSEQEVLALPLPQYKALAGRLAFLDNSAPDVPRPSKEVRIGDLVLVPVADSAKLTAAQYIDYQTMLAQDGTEDKVVELLSVFLVPKGKAYCDGYDIADVQTAIRDHLSVLDVLSLVGFFMTRFAASIASSLSLSEKMVRRITDPEQRKDLLTRVEKAREALLSLTAGDGSRASIG